MQGFPKSIIAILAPNRARVAILLTVLLLFFGVALFSPLHQHKLGKTNSCSFNNLEHQMVSLAEAAAILAPVAHILEPGLPMASAGDDSGRAHIAQDRAPPTFS